MTHEERIERLAEYKAKGRWPRIAWKDLADDEQVGFRKDAEAEFAFLSSLGCVWLSEDQSWPDNDPTEDDERSGYEGNWSDAQWFYCGYNSAVVALQRAHFRKVEIEQREGV